VLLALAICALAASTAFSTRVISDVSMAPTLRNGQRIMISRLVYQLREPKRGEVVLVTDPGDSTRQLIRRVVGLPGETVELRGTSSDARGVQIAINGRPLVEPYVTAQLQNNAIVAVTNRIALGGGEYFVMPDNRAARGDSRDWGPISLAQFDGRAWMTLTPLDSLGWVDHGVVGRPHTTR
jgi:signal peptidase I